MNTFKVIPPKDGKSSQVILIEVSGVEGPHEAYVVAIALAEYSTDQIKHIAARLDNALRTLEKCLTFKVNVKDM